MKFKPVLFASLAVAALGAATVFDTEGSLPFSPQVVHASSSDIVGIKNHDVKITIKQHPTLEKLDITATIDSLPRRNFDASRYFHGYFKNVQNGKTFSFILPSIEFKSYELSVTSEFYWNGGWSIDDGDYWIVYYDTLSDVNDGSARYEHRYYGQSEVVTFKDHKIVSIGGRGQAAAQPQSSQAQTPATTSSSASGKMAGLVTLIIKMATRSIASGSMITNISLTSISMMRGTMSKMLGWAITTSKLAVTWRKMSGFMITTTELITI